MPRRIVLLVSMALALIAFAATSFGIALTSPAPRADFVSLPNLTPQQRDEVKKLAQEEPASGLLSGHTYHITAIYPWTDYKGHLLGGVVQFRLEKAAGMSGEWVALDYDCSEKAHQLAGAIHYQGFRENVLRLRVFVDLHRKEIVGTQPDAGAHFVKGGIPQPYKDSYSPQQGKNPFQTRSCKEG